MTSSIITSFFYHPSIVIFLYDKMLNSSLVFVKTVFKCINGCLSSFLHSKANPYNVCTDNKPRGKLAVNFQHFIYF